MHELRAEIDIRAPAERIWSILIDFPAYSSWNPFITSAEGVAEKGRRLRVTIKPVDGGAMTFRPRVTEALANRELRWLGHLLVPGLFDGEHCFRIESSAGGARFVQSERFSGALVPLLTRRLERGTKPGFEAMNAALKRRAEQGL